MKWYLEMLLTYVGAVVVLFALYGSIAQALFIGFFVAGFYLIGKQAVKEDKEKNK